MAKHKPLLAVLAAALCIKLAYLFLSRESAFFEPTLLDPAYYDEWARRILKGGPAGEGVFYGLPLYPYFLALVYSLTGASVMAAKVAQALLGLVTIFFIYKTAERLSGPRPALWAAGLAAVYGPLFFHESILIPEALSLPLYSASLYLCLKLWEAPTVRRAVLCGVLLGLATLTKAGVLPFAFVLIAALFLRKARSSKKDAAALALAFFAVLAPVTAHNWFVGKDLVPLTSHSGFNFYIGNNERAEGVFLAPEGTGSNVESQIQDSRAVAERDAGRALKPSEVSRFWSDKAWRFIREHPLDFVTLYGRKLLLFFDAREISDVQDYFFEKNFNAMLQFPWPNFSLLGPLFLLGLAASARALRQRGVIYAWTALYIGGVAMYFINARYRLPMLPAFFVVGAAGIDSLLISLREKKRGTTAFYLLILAAGAALTHSQLVGTNWVRDYVSAGDVYQKRNELGRAVSFYAKALEIEPTSAKANLAMGIISSKRGETDAAKDYYEKSLKKEPDNAQALNNLGLWYERQGRMKEALTLFVKAVELKPGMPQAHNNLGMVLAKLGDSRKAVQEFEASLRIDPSNPRTYTNLGLVLYHEGETDKAKALWNKALELDPGFEQARKALELLSRRK